MSAESKKRVSRDYWGNLIEIPYVTGWNFDFSAAREIVDEAHVNDDGCYFENLSEICECDEGIDSELSQGGIIVVYDRRSKRD